MTDEERSKQMTEAVKKGMAAMDAADTENESSYKAAETAIWNYLACRNWHHDQLTLVMPSLCYRAAWAPRPGEPNYQEGKDP